MAEVGPRRYKSKEPARCRHYTRRRTFFAPLYLDTPQAADYTASGVI